MIKEKTIRPRSRKPYHLSRKHFGNEAWFYTNKSSIDLVIAPLDRDGFTYRLSVAELKKIVAAFEKKEGVE